MTGRRRARAAAAQGEPSAEVAATVARLPLAALATQKLKSSGLTMDDARRLRIEVLTAEQLKRRSALLPAYAGALYLPYFTLQGRPSDFWRVRYLEDTRTGWAAATVAEPLRYAQPADSATEVYLPPTIRWAELAENPEAPVVITEGELKAAAACKAGIPTIGLGGVWMFKSARRKLPLLPILYTLKWPGRRVYIVYDSDARTNPQVQHATTELARELSALGALPMLVDLPALPELRKTGLDDFLVANSGDPKPLARLLERAEPYAPCAALYELNAEVVYVRNPGLIVVRADGRKMSPGAFKEHAYANRFFHEERVTAKGATSLVRTPAAPAWLAWERRAELACLTYRPGEPRLTADGAYNYWDGWGVEPARGDVRPWIALLAHLFEGKEDSRRWFERWCAWPLQHPGGKLFSAAVLWGAHQGTGKTLVGYTLMRIYGRNATEIDDEQLSATHNEWAENRQFVLADDITSADKRAARGLADKLKGMITRRELRLNPKYIPSYTVPDCINYLFTANHPDAFFLEDTDRRNFVHHVEGRPLPREFYKQYEAWYLNDAGAAALFYHLLHLPMGDFDAHGPALATLDKATMLEQSLNDLGVWVRQLRDAPEALLKLGAQALEGDLFSAKELCALYDPENTHRASTVAMGRELARAGVAHAARGRPIRMPEGTQQRLYALRNPQRWRGASQSDCMRHYASARGAPIVDKRRRDKHLP